LSKEQQVDEEGKNDHKNSAEEEHHNEVGRLAPKASFLQHSTVSIREYHVEKEAKADGSEE
jgi:hypothetical protein